MNFFKNTLTIVAIFAIGSVDARVAVSTPVKTTAPQKASQPITAKPVSKPTPVSNVETFNLNQFKCISASVLAQFTSNNEKHVILTREARGNPYQQGGKRFTYDDFSGGCEKEDKYEPIISAAREFHEEGNLQQTLGWNLEETIKFVKNNISQVIVYTKDVDKNIPGSREIKNVTYIINFDKYANTLFNNFYTALNKEKERYRKLGKNPEKQVTVEKDKIAKVSWNDLKDAISYQRIISGAEPVKMRALVKDDKTTKFKPEEIILRPFLAIKLRSFFLNQSYEKGENSKIRYYHQ